MKRAATLFLAMIALTGCLPGQPQGRDLTFPEASTYFAVRRADLETVVALLEACRPADAHGYATVWRDGTGAERCARGDQRNLGRIRAWLEAENFVAAGYYTGDRSPLGPLAGAEIVTHTAGLGVSGAMTKFGYVADAKPALGVTRRQDGSVISEARGLGAQPFCWFWEHSQ